MPLLFTYSILLRLYSTISLCYFPFCRSYITGELNYWIPLTNRNLTGVDLWCESDADLGDYGPLGADKGEVASFHGSSCRHYVKNNLSKHSRISLDFRIGIEPFYDPHWEMIGTRNDHLRRKVVL